MPKHAQNDHHGISNRENDDDRIGLTEAFAPVGDVDPAAHRAHAASGADDDARIGLTEAFAPVPPAGEGAHAGGFSYRGDTDDEYPDAFESLEPRDEPLVGDEVPRAQTPPPAARHGRAGKPPVPAYQRKSRRMRKILIVIVVLLVAIIAALCYFAVQWVAESQRVAVQQTQEQGAQGSGALANSESSAKDADSTSAKTTEAPNLAQLLGMTQDQALAALERGATVTSTKAQNEEGNPIKTNVTVALTDEPADTRTGTPTVYLGLNEAGVIVQAGYSASTSALGYGSLSFADAVSNEHIVEKTLREAGITVTDGAAQLPADKTQYSTYASDGTTLERESYSFTGTVELAGAPHTWSSVLQYNYATANTSGNLADTVRIIYVYINA